MDASPRNPVSVAPSAPRLWSARLDPDVESVALARWETALILCRQDRDLRERALLIVSELVTNAITHGAGAAQFTIVLAHDHVRIEVVDGGSGMVRMRTPSLTGGRGFGLYVVDALAHAWGHDPGPPTRVWAHLGIDGRRRRFEPESA